MKKKSLFVRSVSIAASIVMLFTTVSCMEKMEKEEDISHNLETQETYSGVLGEAIAELAFKEDEVVLTLEGVFDVEDGISYREQTKDLKANARVIYTGTVQISDNTVMATFNKGEASNIKLMGDTAQAYIDKKASYLDGAVRRFLRTEEDAQALLSALKGKGSYEYDTTIFMQMLLDSKDNTFEITRVEEFDEFGSLTQVTCYEKNMAVLIEDYFTDTRFATTEKEYSSDGVLIRFDKEETGAQKHTIISARYDERGDEIEYYEETTVEGKTTYLLRRLPEKEMEYVYSVDEEGVEYILNERVYDATGYSYTSTKSNGVLIEESRYEYDPGEDKYNIVNSKEWYSGDNDYRTTVYEYQTDGSIIRTTYLANNEVRSVCHYIEEDGLFRSYFEETYRIYADGKSRVYVRAVNQISFKPPQFEEIQRFEYDDNGVLKEMKITYGVDYSKRIVTYDEGGNVISDVRTDSEGNVIG